MSDAAKVAVKFARGETGHVIAWDGGTLTVTSPSAYAPGAPTQVVVVFDDGEVTVETRTKDSKRTPEGHYNVRLRVINLRREDREKIATLLTP